MELRDWLDSVLQDIELHLKTGDDCYLGRAESVLKSLIRDKELIERTGGIDLDE